MTKLKLSSVLLIGKNSENIRKLKSMLAGYFTEILQIEDRIDIERLSKININLIVITDSMDCAPWAKLLSNLKSWFPETKILGQFQRIDAEIEAELRSEGLIFLGSFEHLRNNFEDIIKTISNTARNIDV